MSYELQFHPDAWDEWNRLDKSVREQLKKKLLERLEEPHIPASRLSGRQNRYKIKLKTVGYRLVYEVLNDRLIVLVVAVGRRDRNAVYTAAARRQTHVSG
ncbi:type II toxin-antitoxin system RelE family toxin [Allochromatium vinosum]|uniref:Addiction module toxin, RelE/StbE family n=1 Tax=Allochromatium vinosum (strain ATCC 17899 / DSM 180 / NBRC 103801 / NCIMB 10441 / D) TaxID=572477 RepID=D3RP24_ALLVD|nr:type II toxin-antitoxin system RelE/ParE family toxin [Allochromatium vinosum]ADC61534.1 addiction module toxin, RelE/StbE family [Allochromatium vinosum DSM 180]